MPAIDLHVHSTASDGLLPPAEVVRAAAAAGLDVLALTDHDTTAGWTEATEALTPGLTLVPGAEISCGLWANEDHWVSLHVLAFLFDPAEPALAEVLAATRDSRITRARRMIELLAADGHPVSWEQVRRHAVGVVGRPHVAAALVEAGLVPDIAGAFTPDWIGARGRYWVGKFEPDVLDAIRLIAGAGGVSVFAHPYASRRGEVVGPTVIRRMAEAGLTGLEVEHPDHDPGQRAALRALAAELGLVATGGSDFHGASKPQPLGAETTRPDQYGALVAAATGTPRAVPA